MFLFNKHVCVGAVVTRLVSTVVAQCGVVVCSRAGIVLLVSDRLQLCDE
jgi:hypothetical protein